MSITIFLCIYIVCLAISILTTHANDYFHQMPEQQKVYPGWQEPGLWRPKWIIDREFDATETEPKKRDRICLRLQSDRSIKIYSHRSRPKLELTRPKQPEEKKKILFETGKEQAVSKLDLYRKSQQEAVEDLETLEGTWWWKPLGNVGTVKLETREGPDKEIRLRHDCRCEFGKLDGYAIRFQPGKLLKYKFSDVGLPIGTQTVGSFTITVSPHRPLISKEYIAFQ